MDNKIVLGDNDEEEFKYLKKSLKLTKIVSEPEVSYGLSNYISTKGCRIYYIRRPEMETAAEKLEFLSSTKLYNLIKNGSYEHIIPDKQNNWIELAENDWEDMIPVALPKLSGKDKRNKNSIFSLSSYGTISNKDEWVFDFDFNNLNSKLDFYINHYNRSRESLIRPLKPNWYNNFDKVIKWTQDIRQYIEKDIEIIFNQDNIIDSLYRPFVTKKFYYSKWLNWSLYKTPLFYHSNNKIIAISGASSSKPFQSISTKYMINLDFLEKTQCLPLYRFDENGNKIENITDWSLKEFHHHYEDITITKEDIFNYVYAVLHNPEYRSKYEINLKREFPRIPFYDDFRKWSDWGMKLMDLHINFESVEPTQLRITNNELQNELYKPKLKTKRDEGIIELDNQTTIYGIPNEAWEYKLGNRSALEWILDQYKEKNPKDPTIREKFNTYRFADYKDKVIDLLMRITTVSVETIGIINDMKTERNK